MNRMDEYTALLAELEQTPEELDHTVNKALNRKNTLQKKRRFFGTSLGGLAACFATFVLLVNLFPPFARACGSVPVLRELAKAVAWSPSLSAAVENDYVQPIDVPLDRLFDRFYRPDASRTAATARGWSMVLVSERMSSVADAPSTLGCMAHRVSSASPKSVPRP